MNRPFYRSPWLQALFTLVLLLWTAPPAHATLASACPGYLPSAPEPEQLTALARCLNEQPLSPDLQFAAHKKRGMLLLQFLRPMEARSEFSAALKINRNDPECYQGLAIVYQFLGKKAEAKAYDHMAQELRKAP